MTKSPLRRLHQSQTVSNHIYETNDETDCPFDDNVESVIQTIINSILARNGIYLPLSLVDLSRGTHVTQYCDVIQCALYLCAM